MTCSTCRACRAAQLRLAMRDTRARSRRGGGRDPIQPLAESRRIDLSQGSEQRGRCRPRRSRSHAAGHLEPAHQRHQVHAGGRTGHVRMARVDGAVEIEVSDTGIGIRADFLPHVFDVFDRAKEPRRGALAASASASPLRSSWWSSRAERLGPAATAKGKALPSPCICRSNGAAHPPWRMRRRTMRRRRSTSRRRRCSHRR